ncbi:hypothetical protein SAMN05421870_104351 [Streptomyces qinglanensis]|uniref:Uncharacterized protein n=1 Tax=Streptomyces qinglanensis TaxID=943816 RepID=A0A1H9S8E2_9ACTN|nr:hypothetical protein SAMN05421870_104351 [Streptomyces qinglanensis]
MRLLGHVVFWGGGADRRSKRCEAAGGCACACHAESATGHRRHRAQLVRICPPSLSSRCSVRGTPPVVALNGGRTTRPGCCEPPFRRDCAPPNDSSPGRGAAARSAHRRRVRSDPGAGKRATTQASGTVSAPGVRRKTRGPPLAFQKLTRVSARMSHHRYQVVSALASLRLGRTFSRCLLLESVVEAAFLCSHARGSPRETGSVEWHHGGGERWRERLAMPAAYDVVALLDGRAVGMAAGLPVDGGACELRSLWVSPRRGPAASETSLLVQCAWSPGAWWTLLPVAAGSVQFCT